MRYTHFGFIFIIISIYLYTYTSEALNENNVAMPISWKTFDSSIKLLQEYVCVGRRINKWKARQNFICIAFLKGYISSECEMLSKFMGR